MKKGRNIIGDIVTMGIPIVRTSRGSGTVNKRLTNCEQIFEKNRMASNENS